MEFYSSVPAKSAQAYFVAEEGDRGAIIVTVEGDAKKYTFGITLVRDSHFIGGLRLNVMGWVGPVGPGEQPYKVRGSFPGLYYPVIFVNQLRVDVKRVPDEQIAREMASAD